MRQNGERCRMTIPDAQAAVKELQTVADLRAFMARHRITPAEVSAKYPCSAEWVRAAVLRELHAPREGTFNRLRACILEVLGERHKE